MFKKSRIKIVAVIMVILVALLTGTLCVIYGSSYMEVYQKNQDMLAHHIELYRLHDTPDFKGPPEGSPSSMDIPEFENNIAFQLSTFYSVLLDKNGNISEICNDSEVYTDEELRNAAQKVLNGRKNGAYKSLVYRCENINGSYLVVFMDNTIMQESITTLFRYTLLFGALALVVIYFLACCAAKRIVQPLEDGYQRQKQFISDAGHELKTPVAVVSANAELLSRELGENQWLSNIQYENERMGMLIGQLLELAQTENVAPKTEKLDLSRLVGAEVLAFESVAYEKGLTLSCDITKDLVVEGDIVQLKQLTSILLDNAIRHSTDGKEVTLTLEEERKFVKLSIINNGKEIPSEEKYRLFERFYRVDTARNDEDKHYGLGLAIAKAIVTAHKGKIDVLCYNGKVEFAVYIPL